MEIYERFGRRYEQFAAGYERSQDYTSGPHDIRAVAGLYEWFVLTYEWFATCEGLSLFTSSRFKIPKSLYTTYRHFQAAL